MAFWDTSAVFKLYVRERDSERVRAVIRISAEIPIISQLSLAEMYRALWPRNSREASIWSGRDNLSKFSDDVRSGSLCPHPVRTRCSGRICEDHFNLLSSEAGCADSCTGRPAAGSAFIARTAELVSTDSRMRAAGTLLGLRLCQIKPNEQVRQDLCRRHRGMVGSAVLRRLEAEGLATS